MAVLFSIVDNVVDEVDLIYHLFLPTSVLLLSFQITYCPKKIKMLKGHYHGVTWAALFFSETLLDCLFLLVAERVGCNQRFGD